MMLPAILAETLDGSYARGRRPGSHSVATWARSPWFTATSRLGRRADSAAGREYWAMRSFARSRKSPIMRPFPAPQPSSHRESMIGLDRALESLIRRWRRWFAE
jgi:hypothetical protein